MFGFVRTGCSIGTRHDDAITKESVPFVNIRGRVAVRTVPSPVSATVRVMQSCPVGVGDKTMTPALRRSLVGLG